MKPQTVSPTCKVIKPEKQNPSTRRSYRVVENRTVDTGQLINYEVQVFSPAKNKWFLQATSVGLKAIVAEYDYLTGS